MTKQMNLPSIVPDDLASRERDGLVGARYTVPGKLPWRSSLDSSRARVRRLHSQGANGILRGRRFSSVSQAAESESSLGGRSFSSDMTCPKQKGLQPLRAILLGLLAALLLFAASLSLAPLSRAQQTDRAKALGKRVKCMCGGCEDAAGLCTHGGGDFAGPCDTAKAQLKEVDAGVARGDSDDLILQASVQEYGPTVLVEPPKKGFSWLVWIAPVAAPLIAFFLIWEVVRRWRHRAALAPAGGPAISPDLLARARREADGDQHD
jgi:cytochrome c-type biogenesis protein CcmH